MNKIVDINEDLVNKFPNRIFSEDYSDYFLDLYKRDFNFDQMIMKHINENMRFSNLKSQMPKDKNHYSLLEFSILKGINKIFESLIETLNPNTDFEINNLIVLLLENCKISIFRKMMNLLFLDDTLKIFDFILNHDLIMRVASTGNEAFLLQLLKEFIIPLGNKQLIPENKLIFLANKKKVTIKGINIFHYIANFKMKNFMYSFLDYLMSFKFESDGKKMKYFLEEFLLMKDEEMSVNSDEILRRNPIFYALKNKFYEMINLCEINDININTDQKEAILAEVGLKATGLAYFSRFLIIDNQNTSKLEKNNFFLEKFQTHLSLLSKLKTFLNSNRKPNENPNRKKSKKPQKPLKIKKIKSNKPKLLEINYILEALILGKKVLELDNVSMNSIKKILKGSKEQALLYLFFEIFPLEVKTFEVSELIFVQNEAFIFYILDKFFSGARKSSEAILNPFEICKKLSQKDKNIDVVNQIFIHPEITALLKSLQQKLKQTTEVVKANQENVIFKLDAGKIYNFLLFCIQHKFNYLLCYLMNIYPSDFIMIYEEAKIQQSFFLGYLVFDAQLTYRMLKILEKSSVYLLLEKEFSTFLENFYSFENDSNNLKLLIESFKVLFLLIWEEGYYYHSIYQKTDSKSIDEALLSIFKKLMSKVQNIRMLKTYMDSLSKEMQNLDYEEMHQNNYIVKNSTKQENIFKTLKPLFNFLIETNKKPQQKYALDINSLEKFINRVFEQKIGKIKIDYKHIGVLMSWAISFMLVCIEGCGVYEELCSEFAMCEFIFYFEDESNGYTLKKHEDLKVFHVNINEVVYFDEEVLAFSYKFNQESYENLKLRIRELTFQGLI